MPVGTKKATTPSMAPDEKNDGSILLMIGSHLHVKPMIGLHDLDTVFAYMTGFESVDTTVRAAA